MTEPRRFSMPLPRTLWIILATVVLISVAARVLIRVESDDPVRRLDAVDNDVLTAVLADFLDNPDKETDVIDVLESGELLFAKSAIPYPRTLDEFLSEGQLEPATQEDRNAVRECAEQLIARGGGRHSPGRFEIQDRRILVQVTEAGHRGSQQQYSRAMRACVPGYSKDGRFAIVRIVFPWGDHGGNATVLLVKEGENWTVRLRRIVFHL